MAQPSLALVLAWSSAGCVGRDTGYREARAAVRERTGVELAASTDDAESQRAVRALLAKPLDADAAAKIALLHNPEVTAVLERVGVARGALVAALRVPNPRVEGALRFRKGGDVDVGIGATINVVDLALMPAREGAASAELEAAELEAAGTAMDVAFEARAALVDAVAAEETYALAASIARATEASADLSERLGQAGNVPPLDSLNERALYEEARQALADAEGQRAFSRERLNAALGLWGEEGARYAVEERLAEPPPSDPPFDAVERVALDKSVELAIAKQRYAASARSKNLARAQGVLPELAVGVDAERTPELGAGSAWGVGPKIGLGVPLFYQGQGAVDAAAAEMGREQALHEALAIQVRSEARALSLRVGKARAQIEHYEKTLLPLREKITRETQLQYNAMGASAFQLLAAKRAEIDAAKGLVAAKREYWTSRAALDLLLAGRLTRPLAHDFGLGVRAGGSSPTD
jgi:outer membrane protein TolC